jgi:subtilisin
MRIVISFIIAFSFFIHFSQDEVRAQTDSTFILQTSTPHQHDNLIQVLSKLDIKINESFSINEHTFTIVRVDQPGVIDNLIEENVITRAELNQKVQTQSLLNQTAIQPLPWGITYTQADLLFGVATHRKIAILDTGIAYNEDINSSIAKKVTFLNGSKFEGQAFDDDSHYHGTHVAGIIAAKNDSKGTVGVDSSARLYIAKVLNRNGTGYVSDIFKGLKWAMAENVDVVNMSLGMPEKSDLFETVLKEAYESGVIVVASSGNNGGAVQYPASSQYTIAVGAHDESGRMPSWSSFGPEVDVLAPGVSIYSTLGNNQFGLLSGTSMATPYVTGSISKLLNKYEGNKSGLRVDWIKKRLQEAAAYNINANGEKTSQAGRINTKRGYDGSSFMAHTLSFRSSNGTIRILSLYDVNEILKVSPRSILLTSLDRVEKYQLRKIWRENRFKK